MGAILEAEAGQATLDGLALPPAQAPAHPGVTLHLAVVGRLLTPAVLHTTSKADVQITAVIEQQLDHHPHALPLVATMTWPNAADLSFAEIHARASARCAHLRAGVDVVCLGYGLETGHHHKQPVLRLIHCDGIDLAARTPHPTHNGGA